jgi:hypothetical protein
MKQLLTDPQEPFFHQAYWLECDSPDPRLVLSKRGFYFSEAKIFSILVVMEAPSAFSSL